MQADQMVWEIINTKHCSYKIKTQTQNFCRNTHNVTGLCNRNSCPLANSQYATITHQKGICYLKIKTAERSHLPNKLWESIKLDKNYELALQQIDKQLLYFQPFLIHKCKQRLTKIRQMIIRMRKMKLQGYKQIVPIKKKTQRRDKIREQKALIAANIQAEIQQELLERLKNGVYEDIYNFNKKAFQRVATTQNYQSYQMSEEQALMQEEMIRSLSDEKLDF